MGSGFSINTSGPVVIRTTFDFLAVFTILIILLHVLLVLKIKSRAFWIFAEWVAVVAIGVGLLITVGEVRGRRLRDFDTFMYTRLRMASERAEEMISICRKFAEMSSGSHPSTSSQFQKAEQWAVAAAEALRTQYETEDWLRFLEKNSSVKPNEHPMIQQLKLPLLVLLTEMQNRRVSMLENPKELNRSGQLLWLSPFSPWLLAIGFALRLAKVGADWRMELGR